MKTLPPRLPAEELLKLKEAAQADRRAELGVAEEVIVGHKAADLQVVADKGLIKGYASVFETFDFYNEKTVKGAFKRSIKEDFKGLDVPKIKVLSQHKWSEPIGLPVVLLEDQTGLYFEAEISGNPDIPAARAMRAMMSEGLVDGVSIGYKIRPGGIVELGEKDFDTAALKGPLWMWPHKLTDLHLMEFSPVTFPANWEARLEVVKSMGRLQVPVAWPKGGSPQPVDNDVDEPADHGEAKPNGETKSNNEAKADKSNNDTNNEQALADALKALAQADDHDNARRLVAALKTLGG